MEESIVEVGALLQEDGHCLFRVWAPLVKQAGVLLNSHYHGLVSRRGGYWEVTIPCIRPGDRYQIQLGDGPPLPDPASRWQPDGVHGASAVAGTHYNWTDQAWKGLRMEELIIYELHTGTFTPTGDFAGIIDQLDYLHDLGITAIELMPIAQFPGDRNWGYDGVFPFAAHTAYGGIEGLKDLVNAAHAKGIAVLLDVVYNHFGPEGNHFPQFGPYTTDKYKGVWGPVVNFDDAYSDGVRNFFWQNALMWLNEFHLDGLRLDAVHAIWDHGARHFIDELRIKVEALSQSTGRHKLLIAELDLNHPRYIQSPAIGGYGLSGQWIDEFHHALHSLVTGEVKGYYEDFGQPQHLVKAIRDGYVYTGQYSQHRKKNFGTYPTGTTNDQFVVFAQNHDQIGNRPGGDRLSSLVSYEMQKLVAATVLLSPYTPLLFMGEEYGEKNPFQYFISHTDEHLVEMVRKGRREEFAYFFGDDEVPDPQAEATFLQCKLSRAYTFDERAANLLSFYKYLINMRKFVPSLRSTHREDLQLLDTGHEYIIGFRRQDGFDALLIFLHFSQATSECHFPLPAGARKVLDSSASVWLGPGELPLSEPYPESWTLQPESVVVFEIPKKI
ncbi:malto-oligosyltrehalose trehalohydrolase [Paraflavitalea pollutisoli]|uniref:malto-oligosyltrehalose trehalohydrolase n=1 Tax=Paraflavitalea pollutisoli TaxID=3034143 RepID=UPI0023EBE83A|nr:malto-oligosyltrehalose trehalohydrolase [Paraflavitalea sp. H1-2-19X]